MGNRRPADYGEVRKSHENTKEVESKEKEEIGKGLIGLPLFFSFPFLSWFRDKSQAVRDKQPTLKIVRRIRNTW